MIWRRIKYHPYWIRLTNWEYWPVYISNIPVFFFWMIHAARARDLFFFSSVNPSIPTGGFFGEEKHRIYQLIPEQYLPRTLLLEAGATDIVERVRAARITYPLVAKPDIGERGMHVKVIDTDEALKSHVRQIPGGVIIQSYIPFPLELSVMVHRDPHTGKGAVTSVCRKVFLEVTGDGRRSIKELISEKPRALLQVKALKQRLDLDTVPARDETVRLEAIGNHCRGTQFLNANDLITPDLESVMLTVLDQMPGVNYGRFDLRTASIESLRAGKDFLIMEFNGTGSEPAHIYDPGFGVWAAYKDLWRHWKIMFRIYQAQKREGVVSMPFKEGLKSLRAYFDYKKRASLSPGSS